jgi:hypothetical protein
MIFFPQFLYSMSHFGIKLAQCTAFGYLPLAFDPFSFLLFPAPIPYAFSGNIAGLRYIGVGFPRKYRR